jgi:C-terminal processing protease CtpA/Prc
MEGPAEAAATCGEYSDRKPATSLPYAKAPEWREVSPGPFQAGTIGDIGVIRIPSFDEQHYLSVCKAIAKPGLDGQDLRLATRAELNRRLVALVDDLRARGSRRLALDISGNGGGSEWSSEVAAMFATSTLKRTAPRLVGPQCDRTVLWQGKSACSIYAADAQVEQLPAKGIWTGPLAVLVDRRSASASEELVTWLKDNGRATIAGERTYGAGCGYVDGGSAIALTAAPLHIMIPNCSRYTGDGINEIEGIAPNVAIDWMTMTPEKAAAALARLF